MRKVSFHVGIIRTVARGMKRARALMLRQKSFNYGSAAILALLVTPFALQAVAATITNNGDQGNVAPAQHIDQSSEVKAEMDDKPKPESNAEVKVETDSSSDADYNDVNVTINGQKVPVPERGSIHRKMTGNNSETSVDIQIDNQSGSSGSTHQSTTIMVDGHSYDTDDDNRNERRDRRNRR